MSRDPMESLEGYSYYDTPTGPQYVRNNGLDAPLDSRSRRNTSLKFHPYAGVRRSERSQPSTPTEMICDATAVGSPFQTSADVNDGAFFGTVDPQTLLARQATASGAHDSRSRGHCDFQMAQTEQAVLTQMPDPQFYANTLASPKGPDLTLHAVAELEFTQFYQSHQSVDEHMQSPATPIFSPHLQNNEVQSLPQSQQFMHGLRPWQARNGGNLDPGLSGHQSQIMPTYTTDPRELSHVWSSEPLVRAPSSQIVRTGSGNSNHSGPKSDLASTHEHWCLEGEKQQHCERRVEQDLPFGEHGNLELLELSTTENTYLHQPMWQSDHNLLGNGVEAALFEYGPFYEHADSPQSSSMFGRMTRPQEFSPAVNAYQRPRSLEEQERPVPQVGFVGGYFAPDEDVALPRPPEINSQGNIRIARLPTKKVAVVYDVPAIPDMTVSQLKTELKKRNLSAIGKKSDLQDRLAASNRGE